MHKEVFIVSVGIAFLIQIVHSILTKGGKFTLEFFGGGLLFGFVREFIYFSFIRSYEFPDMPVKLLNVPIFIPIGWVFTFYLAYEFVNKLLEPKTVKDYKDFIIFAAFFSTFICIPIETAAMNMNWWNLIIFPINDNIAPFILMSGWANFTLMFFCIYYIVKKKLPREQLGLFVFLLINTIICEFKLIIYFGSFGWLLPIIGLWVMFKYNKELIFIYLVTLAIVYGRLLFNLIPNAIFVIIEYIFIFVYILIKLRYRETKHQLYIKESL
jgi:hypothetical protein